MPSRRTRPELIDSTTAEEQAKALARAEQDRLDESRLEGEEVEHDILRSPFSRGWTPPEGAESFRTSVDNGGM